MVARYPRANSEGATTMHKNVDMMPRALAMTLVVGGLLGSSFWAALIAAVVR